MDSETRRYIQDLQAGRIGPVGSAILETSGTTTTVETKSCSASSCVLLFPLDAGGATEFGAGTLRVAPANGSFVITHTVSASPARTYRWAVLTGINH